MKKDSCQQHCKESIAKKVLTAGIHIDLYRQFGGSSPALGKFSLGIQAWTSLQRQC